MFQCCAALRLRLFRLQIPLLDLHAAPNHLIVKGRFLGRKVHDLAIFGDIKLHRLQVPVEVAFRRFGFFYFIVAVGQRIVCGRNRARLVCLDGQDDLPFFIELIVHENGMRA